MAKKKMSGGSARTRRGPERPLSTGRTQGAARPKPRGSRFDTERFNRLVERMVEDRSFESQEEFNQHLEEAVGGKNLDEMLAEAPADNPVEQAQELAFQSMEEQDPRRALALARKALEIDPDCVDARRVEILVAATDPDGLLAALRELLEKGRESLGPGFFEENRGSFWGLVKTRPYMRTLELLARLFLSLGREGEAAEVMNEMIELNSHDNQGVRYPLLGYLLGQGDVLAARTLLNRFADEDTVVFAWARAIERMLSGDFDAAAAGMEKAVYRNPHVVYLMGGIEETPGEKDRETWPEEIREAQYCIEDLGPVWERQPDVLPWIMSEMSRLTKS